MFKELSWILKSFSKASLYLAKSEKTSLAFATILMLIVGFLTNLPAVLLGDFVDQTIKLETPSFDMAIPFILAMIAIVVGKEALNVWRKYLIENVATQTEKKQTVATIRHLLRTDISFFYQHQVGALHGRVMRSIQGLIQLIKIGFIEFFPVFFSALAALGIAFYKNAFFASFMILVIPTGLFLIIKQITSEKGIRIALLRKKEKIDGKVVEMMGGLETVRTSDMSEYEVGKIEQVCEELRKTEIIHHIRMAFFDASKYLNEAFFYILVVSLSIYFAVQGTISTGDILMYSLLFMNILNPLRELHKVLDHAHEATIKVNDLQELRAQPEDASYDFSEEPTSKKRSLQAIEVERLHFAYGEEKVIKSLSLKIKTGEKIGIAGASGCGKSTFIKILLRLIHDYKGSIIIGGEDLRNIDRAALSQQICYVPQSTYIFSGTIKENLVYGTTKKVSTKDIENAAKQANIWDEIQSSLGGLSGIIAENGRNLSGGQRQRLAIARLLLRDPDILILDEATSALDNKNEQKVQKSLEEHFKDKTMIIIAHRLTTLKNCDRILVLDKGSIAQEGNYDGLSKEEGLFKDFVEHGGQ